MFLGELRELLQKFTDMLEYLIRERQLKQNQWEQQQDEKKHRKV